MMMKPQHTPYQSIACSLYDQLEAFATKHAQVTIVFATDDGSATTEGVIVDLFAKDGAEFLKLNDGTIIRLDRLITVNGIPMNSVC